MRRPPCASWFSSFTRQSRTKSSEPLLCRFRRFPPHPCLSPVQLAHQPRSDLWIDLVLSKRAQRLQAPTAPRPRIHFVFEYTYSKVRCCTLNPSVRRRVNCVPTSLPTRPRLRRLRSVRKSLTTTSHASWASSCTPHSR